MVHLIHPSEIGIWDNRSVRHLLTVLFAEDSGGQTPGPDSGRSGEPRARTDNRVRCRACTGPQRSGLRSTRRATKLTLPSLGFMKELDESLVQHRMEEMEAGRAIYPASRAWSCPNEDREAVAVCEALERPGSSKGCPKLQRLGPELEW